MPNNRNEVSYYPEIQRFIEEQLKSNFRATNQHQLNVFWGIGELKTNLQRIIAENPTECKSRSGKITRKHRHSWKMQSVLAEHQYITMKLERRCLMHTY